MPSFPLKDDSGYILFKADQKTVRIGKHQMSLDGFFGAVIYVLTCADLEYDDQDPRRVFLRRIGDLQHQNGSKKSSVRLHEVPGFKELEHAKKSSWNYRGDITNPPNYDAYERAVKSLIELSAKHHVDFFAYLRLTEKEISDGKARACKESAEKALYQVSGWDHERSLADLRRYLEIGGLTLADLNSDEASIEIFRQRGRRRFAEAYVESLRKGQIWPNIPREKFAENMRDGKVRFSELGITPREIVELRQKAKHLPEESKRGWGNRASD